MPVPLSSNKKTDNTYVRYLMGRDIDRYSICPEKEQWISYGDWLAEPRPIAPFFDPIKILVRQTADRIIAVVDTDKYVTLNNVHNLRLTDEQTSHAFILGIFNSKAATFFHQTVVGEVGRVFAEVKVVDL